MSANPETTAPNRRRTSAQGKEHSGRPQGPPPVTGHESDNTSSPEGAKESGNRQSEIETGAELLARILNERRENWQGRGKYQEPAAPEPLSDVELPEDWVWTGFEQLADGTKNAIKAGPFGSSLKKSVYTSSGFKIYGQEQVIKGDPYFGDYFISRELFDRLQSCAVKPGDILISLVGTTGKVLILPDDCVPGVINPRLLKLSLNRSGVNPKFIKILLESPMTRAFFKLAAHGGTMEILNVGILKTLPIPLPSLSEQQWIVAETEKQFTRLEAGVAALRRVQANLKRYRSAVLKAACEGRLVPTEAELANCGNRDAKFETGESLLARILSERRNWFDRKQATAKSKKNYTEPAQPESRSLPSLPAGWTWGTWNQLSNWVTYGFTRPMPHIAEGIPIITAKGVNRGRIDFDGADRTTKEAYMKLSEKDRPQSGDILITKDGTIGRAAVVGTDRDFCINQSVAVIWLRSCPMERKFLLTVIESDLTQKPIWAKARGVAIQHLSITDFAEMALPIPPLAEQTRIVAEVERRLSVVEELEAVVSANLQRATRLRQSILQKAFTGRLKIGQDT